MKPIMKVIHPLEPVYDKESRVLILGSMPSIKSREVGFYYGHPKNRFWSTLEKVYGMKIGGSKEEKVEFLTQHHIALFDVLKSCDINSSKDASIRNPVPNNFTKILENSKITAIFTTGRKAYNLYKKYCYPETKIEAISLPSTSPCNCSKGIEEELERAYKIIKQYTDK